MRKDVPSAHLKYGIPLIANNLLYFLSIPLSSINKMVEPER